ncbi:MAG: hypothetical protein AAB590_00775 [Patescibacteria group bacterium]
MINLLPQESKVEIRKWYHNKITVVSLTFLLVALLLSIIFLVPALIATRTKQGLIESNLATAKSRPISQEAENLKDMIREVNAKLKIISGESTSSPTFSSYVDKIFAHKTSAISLTHIEESEPGHIVLRGLARTRTALLAFIRELDGDETFAEVISPISNLINNTDIEFSVDLKTK